MAFSLVSVNPVIVPENGGHLIEISGTAFNIAHAHKVYIGTTGTTADAPCYSGVPGQGNVVYPITTTLLCVYTPLLDPIGGPYKIFVRDLDNSDEDTLTSFDAIHRDYNSHVFSGRAILPRFYKTGGRSMDTLVPADPPVPPAGIWDNWWYFDGTNDWIHTPDNVDFDFNNGPGTWLIGYRPDFTGGGDEYLVNHEGAYRMVVLFSPGDPENNDRQQLCTVTRAGSGGLNDYRKDLTYPAAKAMGALRWVHTPNQRTYNYLYQDTGLIGGYTQGVGAGDTIDGSTRIIIGARYYDVGSKAFKGRLHFAAWYEAVNLGNVMQDIFDEVATLESENPTLLIKFNKVVEATLTPDIQVGANAPYPFTVVGSPLLNGP